MQTSLLSPQKEGRWRFSLYVLVSLCLLTDGHRTITFTKLNYPTSSSTPSSVVSISSLSGETSQSNLIDVNGMRLPPLRLKRNEEYLFENRIKDLTLCIRYQGVDYESGLSDNCVKGGSFSWTVPMDAPTSGLAYYLDEDLSNEINIHDTAPHLLIWNNKEVYIPPGNPIHFLLTRIPSNISLTLSNIGDADLNIQHAPHIASLSQPATSPPSSLPLSSPLPPTIPASSYHNLDLTFVSPFNGYISFFTDDVQYTYSIALFIGTSRGLTDPYDPSLDSDGPDSLNGFDPLVDEHPETIAVPSINSANPTVAFIVVPLLSLMTVCATVIFMGVVLGKKERKLGKGKGEGANKGSLLTSKDEALQERKVESESIHLSADIDESSSEDVEKF